MKKYLVFLSGGMHSTAALLKVFFENKVSNVDVVHIILKNKENNWEYKKSSCDNIISWFKHYYSFNYYEYEFQFDGIPLFSAEVVGLYAYLLIRKNLVYYDFITNGTSKSDENYSAQKRDSLRHNSYYSGLITEVPFWNKKLPVWRFPLIEMTNEEIIEFLVNNKFPMEYFK